MIAGLGDRADEIAARFFKRVNDRGLEGVKLSKGSLVIKLDGNRTDSRDYFCIDKDLGDGAFATMAARIAPSGTDLFVEWRQFVTPSAMMVGVIPPLFRIYNNWGVLNVFLGHIPTTLRTFIWTFGIILAAVSVGILMSSRPGEAIGPVIGAVVCFVLMLWKKPGRRARLEGFQDQECNAFQASIRSALEEALGDAGIGRARRTSL